MSNIHHIHGSPKRRINLLPGDHYVSDKDVVIGTLLGSCVSACLYDPVQRVVGMNHFMLSAKKHAGSIPLCLTEAGRYGVHAMELIINGMLRLGAKGAPSCQGLRRLFPLFGAPRCGNFNGVGETNCRFILEFLRDECIRLVASNLGGNEGG